MEFLTIKEYETIAKNIIRATFPNQAKLLSQPDKLGELITILAFADKEFDGRGTLHGYRKQRVKWWAYKILEKFLKDEKHYSLDIEYDNPPYKINVVSTDINHETTTDIKDEISILKTKVIDSKLIKSASKEYILYFLDTMDLDKTSKQFGIKRATLYNSIKKQLKTLKI